MSTEQTLNQRTQYGPTSDEETATESETVLELEEVSKRFGDETAVENLSVSVRDGELLTLLGPSGCGKTTTLRLIAGLERPDAGTITINDERVAAGGENGFTAPEDRDVGVVFQDFALFPHMTAAENIAFGLDDTDDANRARVEELLELVGLSGKADARPEELSGGQKQRIALARSLAPEPDILLLDEPFSNLDVDLRVEMREEVRQILDETGVTAVSVTHDQEEALSISDRIAVVSEGDIKQIGTPESVFQHPRSRFVANFLGHANFLSGYVEADMVSTTLGSIGRDQIYGLDIQYDYTEIDVLVRPDDVIARPADEEEADGHVTYRRYLGPSIMYRVELENGEFVECMHNHTEALSLDEPVAVDLTATHKLAWFPTERQIDD